MPVNVVILDLLLVLELRSMKSFTNHMIIVIDSALIDIYIFIIT